MKYRIKCTTYANGRKEYIAQFRTRSGLWLTLDYAGCTSSADTLFRMGVTSDRDRALQRIDLHFLGNTRVQTVEFEYITKTHEEDV
jgi:hypothetical protein